MNIFNRAVVVLLLVVTILLSATAIVLPQETFTFLQNQINGLDLYTSKFIGKLLMTAVLLAVIALCILVLLLEFRRGTSKTVRVEKITGGEARVATESVVQRVQYNLDQLPQILSVKPRVTAKGRKMDILLDVETTQDVNIPSKTEELSQLTRSVIEEQMGLKLGKVIVTVRHSPTLSSEHKHMAPPQPQVASATPDIAAAAPTSGASVQEPAQPVAGEPTEPIV